MQDLNTAILMLRTAGADVAIFQAVVLGMQERFEPVVQVRQRVINETSSGRIDAEKWRVFCTALKTGLYDDHLGVLALEVNLGNDFVEEFIEAGA